MKKLLFLLTIILALTIQAEAQQINFPEGNILIYSDTNALTGGDTLIRSLFAYVPQKVSDSVYEYQYKKLYWLNDVQIKNEFISKEFHKDSTVTISGTEYTFEEMYNLILSINVTNWNAATWQTYLQLINN